jgi:hypothetical protein
MKTLPQNNWKVNVRVMDEVKLKNEREGKGDQLDCTSWLDLVETTTAYESEKNRLEVFLGQ